MTILKHQQLNISLRVDGHTVEVVDNATGIMKVGAALHRGAVATAQEVRRTAKGWQNIEHLIVEKILERYNYATESRTPYEPPEDDAVN